ncbi:hypothetical protein AB0I98_16975 [Streptomyces sp. NPDC050211]|uniref:hypothetical protein n=1 Tax=Streptomyces sp. NPDC050211 TaxID=3154932 RepID=UPI003417EB8A
MTSAPEWISVPRMTVPTVWLATPDGLVSLDLIAIELAMNGRRKRWTLSQDEARYAARVMLDRKVPYSVIASRVGVNTNTLRAWFPGEIEPADDRSARSGSRKAAPTSDVKCGTRRGYGRHHQRGEVPCRPCKDANAMADRYYRKHGTYLGAPEPSAVAL